MKSQGFNIRHCGEPSPVHGSCGCVPFASLAGVSTLLPALEHACECEGSPPPSAAAAAVAAGVFVLAALGELSASCAFSLFSKPARRIHPHCSESDDWPKTGSLCTTAYDLELKVGLERGHWQQPLHRDVTALPGGWCQWPPRSPLEVSAWSHAPLLGTDRSQNPSYEVCESAGPAPCGWNVHLIWSTVRKLRAMKTEWKTQRHRWWDSTFQNKLWGYHVSQNIFSAMNKINKKLISLMSTMVLNMIKCDTLLAKIMFIMKYNRSLSIWVGDR